MGPLTNYASFLAYLLALGPKLQALWPKITAVITAVSELMKLGREIFPAPAAFPEAVPAPTLPPSEPGVLRFLAGDVPEGAVVNETELLEATEAKIGALIAGDNSLFDASVLRSLWGALSQHPEAILLFGRLVAALASGS